MPQIKYFTEIKQLFKSPSIKHACYWTGKMRKIQEIYDNKTLKGKKIVVAPENYKLEGTTYSMFTSMSDLR